MTAPIDPQAAEGVRDAWTPGPWKVDGPAWNQIVWSSPEHRVCFLAHTNGVDEERDLATGRLIAAAPELVEALREAVEKGLIYWEPNTTRGAIAKADMIARFERLLDRIEGDAA